uniref:hypothetical protein n=1 Tax=Thaumasiovibrio occultus TaxID=1891184 RepID=UPI000B35FFDB|nr:hypothetical protein [Thaumasiovibrio occultus]
MEISVFIDKLLSFPTGFFFVPFSIIFFIMLIDMVFDFVGEIFDGFDGLDFDDATGGSLLLPPILSKVPLPMALCLTFFIGTIISFYVSEFIPALPSIANWIIGAVQLLATAFLSLHIAAIVFKPIAPLFDQSKSFATVVYVGLTGRVHSPEVNASSGEVMVKDKGTEFLLEAFHEGEEPLRYGDEIVIVAEDLEKKRYEVIKV